jgi:hypothetical protein
MATKTVHFIQAVALDRPVLVEPEQARQVMEADLQKIAALPWRQHAAKSSCTRLNSSAVNRSIASFHTHGANLTPC